MIHDFNEKLSFSLGERERFDLDVLKGAITGCVEIVKTDTEADKAGVDYIATLRRGAQVLIDGKAREKGASKYWKNGEPELALEKWSVCPEGWFKGKTGWTLNENSNVDLILYTFDPDDSKNFYILPFQLLRMAFIQNILKWQTEYHLKKQRSGLWTSEAVFVPASVVIKAVTEQMKGCVA